MRSGNKTCTMKKLKKLLAYPLSVIFYFFFFLTLLVFHPIQWISLKLGGYEAHKKSVDIFNFFLLRFDLAFPLRKPWLPENERWTQDEIDFLSPAWRSDNLILNIAIGYPF